MIITISVHVPVGAVKSERRNGESVPDVVVPVAQEFAQDVDRHDSETAIRLDLENGHDSLVKD